jgi:hypothetical protein
MVNIETVLGWSNLLATKRKWVCVTGQRPDNEFHVRVAVSAELQRDAIDPKAGLERDPNNDIPAIEDT